MNKALANEPVAAEEEQKPQLALVEDRESEPAAPETDGPESASANNGKGNVINFAVRLDSLGVSRLDRFSLVRIFRKEWRSKIAFYRSGEGGYLTLDEAIECAAHKIDEKEREKIFKTLMTLPAEAIEFPDLYKLWEQSPEDAEFIWEQMKQEARVEFMTGHIAGAVFQPVHWMRSAWERAKFLGVRDAFIDEYKPDGGVELALVDMMAQSWFLYLHWTEESVKRTKTDPRRHNEEYRQWQWWKQETNTSSDPWEPGNWELPYATELECQEQALKMADHFSRLFHRSVKQMDNHRLAKAKLKRLSARTIRG